MWHFFSKWQQIAIIFHSFKSVSYNIFFGGREGGIINSREGATVQVLSPSPEHLLNFKTENLPNNLNDKDFFHLPFCLFTCFCFFPPGLWCLWTCVIWWYIFWLCTLCPASGDQQYLPPLQKTADVSWVCQEKLALSSEWDISAGNLHILPFLDIGMDDKLCDPESTSNAIFTLPPRGDQHGDIDSC